MHVAAIVSFLQQTQEKAPDPNDVVAGWTGFVVFIAMILAVAVIGYALTRSLKTAQRAKDAGVYDDGPAAVAAGRADRTGDQTGGQVK